jgi:hypothetical protein
MRSNVGTISARVGIAALVSLGVFAVPGGPASAAASQTGAAIHTGVATALTPAECTAIRQQKEGLEARVLTLQDLLSEASPAQKAAIIRMILKLEAEIGVLDAQLAAGCPA